jgi:hypothetical protein
VETVSLRAPYLDTAADQLCFSLDLAERPALAERSVVVGGLEVRLRLLGASHQVFAGPVRETVACLRDAVTGLPEVYTREPPGWRYRFRARTDRLAPADFTERVDGILGRVEGCEHALCGVFPGSPQALTAVLVETADGSSAAGLVWRTWHTYPQHGQIVSTYTRLEAR